MTGKDLMGDFALPENLERTDVDEDAARRFERASEKKAKAKTKGRPSKGSPKKLRSGKEPLSIYLVPELAERLRVKCALERVTLSDAVSMALEEWLD